MVTDAERRAYAQRVAGSAAQADPAFGARLLEAFARVHREDFLGPGPWFVSDAGRMVRTPDADPHHVLRDALVALARDRGINNGQPSLHAAGIAAARPQPGETVVHVGAGTGYYTALLRELVQPGGRVVAYEIEPDLAARAAQNLAAWPDVTVLHRSASAGTLPPCDVLYACAGASHPPAGWLDALRDGGRLVFPLTGPDGFGLLLALTRVAADRFAARALMGVVFTPCIGAQGDAQAGALAHALRARDPGGIRSLRRGRLPDASAWVAGDGWWLSTEPVR